MKRSKKVLLIVLASGLLLAAGVGVFVHFSTRQTLLRAEAFLFRRLQVARVDNDAFRFFYATNRGAGSLDGGLEDRFNREHEAGLRFGSFDARIQPTLALSAVFDPQKWSRNEEVAITSQRSLAREELVRQVRDMVEQSPHRSLLLIVHGYRERFVSALRKTAFVSHVLDINTPVMVFDWPGDQPGLPLVSYRRAAEIAEASAPDLADLLRLVLTEVQPGQVWLVANSMGGQVVAEAFGLLYEFPEFADLEPEIEEVVLTAPDIDMDEFDDRFEDEIRALTKNLTVYVSSNDRALIASRLANRGRRRGESTLNSRDVRQDQIEEAIRLAEMIDPDSDRVTLVDVTPVNRTVNFHNFYLESPEVYNDIFRRLANERAPRSRELYPVRTQAGAVYWVLTRGR